MNRKNLIYISFAIFLSIFCITQFIYLNNTQPFPILGFTPELILEYQAGINFEKYGFLKHFLSVDYSASSDPSDHPYIYTHQFDLPAILIGVLLTLNVKLLYIRLFFVVISCIGTVYLFKIIHLLSKNLYLALFIACLSCLYFNESFVYAEHSTHSFYSVIYFGGLYHLINYFKSGLKKNYIYFCLFTILGLVANIIAVTPLIISSIAFTFIFERKFIWKVVLTQVLLVSFFIALMIFRNAYVFGWISALQDFFYTISNRIFSIPSREELSRWYAENNIVLWGVQETRPGMFWYWVKQPYIYIFNVFGVIPLIPILYLLFKSDRFKRQYLKLVYAFAIIFIGTYSWHILFLSYGSNYIFHFLDKMIYLFLIATIFMAYIYIWRNRNYELKNLITHKRYSAILSGFILGVGFMVSGNLLDNFYAYHYKPWLAKFKTIRDVKQYPQIDLKTYSHSQNNADISVATNIDGTIASFFIENAIVKGGCNIDALLNPGDGNCISTFNIKNKNLPQQFILYSTLLLPGHATCHKECRDEELLLLSKKFKLIPTDLPGIYLFAI